MFDWIKSGKEHPDFWKKYLAELDKKEHRTVVVSFNTTGRDMAHDVILSIGAVGVNATGIIVSDSFEVIIMQYKYLHDNEMSNDFIIESLQTKLGEPEAVQAFVEYIGNSVLVGHRIRRDIDMLNSVLEKMGCGKLKNEALDIEIMFQKLVDENDQRFSIEDILQDFNIEKNDQFSSANDAYLLALSFLKLRSRLGIKLV